MLLSGANSVLLNLSLRIFCARLSPTQLAAGSFFARKRPTSMLSSSFAGLRQILINRSDFYEEPIECAACSQRLEVYLAPNLTSANPKSAPAAGVVAGSLAIETQN